jgi:hypothetical protein
MAVERPCGDPGAGTAGDESGAVRRDRGGVDPAEGGLDPVEWGADAAGVGCETSGADGPGRSGTDAAAGDGPAAGHGEDRAPSDADDPPPQPGPSRVADPRVLRRLAEVFGDLPRVTSDELGLDEPGLDRGSPSATERELLANRPPHHDRD